MPTITISRQYASGGSEIAALVARRLGWELIDNEFIDRVAELAGLSREEVERREERVPSFVERLARAMAGSAPELFVASGEAAIVAPPSEEEIVRITEAVINEAVQHERVVLVGRGAQAYLAQRSGTLHVYVVAPREVRIQRAMERLKIDRKEAERTVDQIDEGRRRYVRTHYRRQWDDPSNYHLVLNTGSLTYDRCAELIVEAARLEGWL
ncbi:MAG: cytidylate kinase [Gemmatimonadales bacterium]|nr:Cytidylate kinase [bacterium HR33]GIW51929.1 MAG: cytidylate kinase [Gemmatimonadales bacterium]